jgi:hypothetical protein
MIGIHVGTFRDGSFGQAQYIHGKRGHVTVYHDTQLYVYDVRGWRAKAREVRSFIYSAWGDRGGNVHISGHFPNYTVDVTY